VGLQFIAQKKARVLFPGRRHSER